jgi:hypothetical protein
METYIRGSTIVFTAAFADKAGKPVTPDRAVVNLVYRNTNQVQQKVSISMTVNGNVAEASWDSSGAAAGLVHWSVKGYGANAIVQDGSLTLTGNEANQ